MGNGKSSSGRRAKGEATEGSIHETNCSLRGRGMLGCLRQGGALRGKNTVLYLKKNGIEEKEKGFVSRQRWTL